MKLFIAFSYLFHLCSICDSAFSLLIILVCLHPSPWLTLPGRCSLSFQRTSFCFLGLLYFIFVFFFISLFSLLFPFFNFFGEHYFANSFFWSSHLFSKFLFFFFSNANMKGSKISSTAIPTLYKFLCVVFLSFRSVHFLVCIVILSVTHDLFKLCFKFFRNTQLFPLSFSYRFPT